MNQIKLCFYGWNTYKPFTCKITNALGNYFCQQVWALILVTQNETELKWLSHFQWVQEWHSKEWHSWVPLLNRGVLKECHSFFKNWVGAGVALKILQIYIEECHSWNFERIPLEIIIKKISTHSCAIMLSVKAKCNEKFDSNYYKYY